MSDIAGMFEEEASREVTVASDAGLQELRALVRDMRAYDAELARMDDALKELKDKRRNVAEVLIPDKFAELGLRSFTTDDGDVLTVDGGVSGSIKEDMADDAFAFLREHNYGDIIKNVVSVAFGAGEDAAAVEAQRLLKEAGLTPEQKQAVHPSTLRAFLKEQILEQGNPLFASEDVRKLFGVYQYNMAKLKKARR